MYKNHIDLLHHILLECKYIESVITPEVSKEDFMSDETLKRAVVRSLEVIGEATKKIPADIKLSWKDISWKNIAGMRDRLIHDYMGINYYKNSKKNRLLLSRDKKLSWHDKWYI